MNGRSLKEGEVEELKSRVDIQSVVSNYVSLKRTGKNYTGLCPFHKEKTPSFTVDPARQLYHCFGCGTGGDIINFIEKIENMEFIEAVEFLAKKAGYQLKYNIRGTGKSIKAKDRLYELNELARKYYQFVLFNSADGKSSLDYLKKRGFSEKTIKEFGIGFSLDNWSSFSDFALKRGFKPRELIDCGLCMESSNNKNTIYDRFRGRIMFPIEDIVGKTIGFGGRITLKKIKTASQNAKYINTPETRLFSKSKNIYNISQAKNQIVKSDEVLIVEGYTDVMALHQAGIENAVASLGTALTSDQIKILGRFTKNIILVFDSDAAGMKASLKGIERLKEYNGQLDLYLENNLNIQVALLEEGYDPAEYVSKAGRDGFLEKIRESENIIDFTIDAIINRYDINSLSGKLRASDTVIRFISTLSSRMVQEECIKKVSRRLNLKEELLLEEMMKKKDAGSMKPAYQNVEGQPDTKDDGRLVPRKRVEIEALKIMVNGLGKDLEIFMELGPGYFRFEDTRELYSILQKAIREAGKGGRKVNFPVKVSSGMLKNAEVQKLYNYILFSEIHYGESQANRAAGEVLTNLRRIHLTEEIDYIRKKMIEYEEAKRDKTGEDIEKLDRKYDNLYQKLINLEQEKLNLGIIS
ncbi:MAG: DNA primase [Actinobacteria bacterium]|nr:DNA primase [Actinomycetota bacterium]